MRLDGRTERAAAMKWDIAGDEGGLGRGSGGNPLLHEPQEQDCGCLVEEGDAVSEEREKYDGSMRVREGV